MSSTDINDTMMRRVSEDLTLPCLLVGCYGRVGSTRLDRQVIGPCMVISPYCTERPGWAASAALVLHEGGLMVTQPLSDQFNCNMGCHLCKCQDTPPAASRSLVQAQH